MKNAVTSDAILIARYKDGDENAFAELLNKYKSKVYTTIYLIVKDKYVAEDLLQDAFIKAVKRIKAGTYNEEGKFGPWIGRIGHNLAIDYFRKRKRHPEILTEDGTGVFNTMEFSEDSSESIQIEKETHKKVRDLI